MMTISMTISVLAVGSPPEVLEPLQDLTKTAPDDIVLECTINPGDPKAELTWFRKDRQVQQCGVIISATLCLQPDWLLWPWTQNYFFIRV